MRNILAELPRLRRKFPQPYRAPFPDLFVEPRTAPCSNTIVAIEYPPAKPSVSTGLIVSHLHKSSYQVLTRAEVQFAGRKV
jgi:hypothetical protein